jgi:diguanylate cyclase (GGDEF)-like protein
MIGAPLPHDEASRLAALHDLAVLDTAPEAEFDALVQAASLVCGSPISLISLVDAQRQWFKANHGLPGATQTSRDLAFCAHAILGDEVFEVRDASLDPRFADNPLVTDAPHIRFYAGAPLQLSGGERVGTLCVIDRRPRRLSTKQRRVLESLSVAAARALEGRRAGQRLRQLGTELADANALLGATLTTMQESVITLDRGGRIRWLNAAAGRLLGIDAAHARGRGLGDLLPLCSQTVPEPLAALLADIGQGHRARLPDDAVLRRSGQPDVALEGDAVPVSGSPTLCAGSVLVLRDVTTQRRAASELAFQARHDALTGLLNRSSFDEHLRQALQRAGGGDEIGTLLCIDLDHFKVVNDSCGHAAGDDVLREVSRMLREAVRAGDVVARLGGDEFAMLMPGCPPQAAEQAGERLCRRLEDYRFEYAGQRFRIGASVGVAPVGGALRDPVEVMRAADACAIVAKQSGRNRVVRWIPERAETLGEQVRDARWVERLGRALDEDRFVLFGQHVVPLRSGAGRTTVEVLLRLAEPGAPLLAPGAFMPAAERFQLMPRIDRWVITRALDWMRDHAFDGDVQRVAVNLSGQSVADAAFRRWLVDLLDRTPPAMRGRLTLEITETVAIRRLEEAQSLMHELRSRGVRIALDDFGAGSSTFSYLKHLPVDDLKIDGQFVRQLRHDALDQAAVRSFVAVARAVGLGTVAEFVEDEQTLAMLAEIGVDFVQGYAIHRPAPLASLGAARDGSATIAPVAAAPGPAACGAAA